MTIEKALELNMKKRKETTSVKQAIRFFKIYLFPITSILVFIIIIFGFVIPKVFNMFGQLEEIERLIDELSDRQKELTAVQGMAANEAVLRRDVDTLNSLAPTEVTEVVNFGRKIADLALQYELVISNQVLSDNTQGLSNESFLESNELLILREVPNVFEIRGNAADVFEFLDALSRIDDFIVVDEMELSAGEEGEWNMSINLVKYQFSELSDDSDLYQAYVQVPITARVNADVQEYLNNRRQQRTQQLTETNNINQNEDTENTFDNSSEQSETEVNNNSDSNTEEILFENSGN